VIHGDAATRITKYKTDQYKADLVFGSPLPDGIDEPLDPSTCEPPPGADPMRGDR
jgi:hypothetical protein